MRVNGSNDHRRESELAFEKEEKSEKETQFFDAKYLTIKL